jgi:hypothetical protein
MVWPVISPAAQDSFILFVDGAVLARTFRGAWEANFKGYWCRAESNGTSEVPTCPSRRGTIDICLIKQHDAEWATLKLRYSN